MSTGLPASMTAIQIVEPGGPEVLQPATVPLPEPGEGQLLIAVEAAGVNRPDVLQRKGAYAPPPDASPLPGLEVAGTVAALGPGAEDAGWKVGDQVCALTPGGGYAEYCVTYAAHCLPIPKGLSLTEAAALPETYFTVWTNVFDRGRLQEGESFLVHGGSSGIGTTAIQLAKAFGARVFTTAGNAEKCAACEALGAERAINYREEDFGPIVRDLTGGTGVDVVLDMVGGEYLARDIDAMAVDGRHVSIAVLGGAQATFNIQVMMVKRLTLTGSTLRPRSPADKAAIARSLRDKVWPLLDSGAVKPVMHATFPLAEAAAAHTMLDEGAHIGKIVLLAGS